MKACVVGTGTMGSNHARVLSTLPGVELVGIVEQNAERANQIAAKYSAKAYTSIEQILSEQSLDFAVIAVPTSAHFQTASAVLSAGVNVLIEKPISATVKEAEALIALANEKNVLLSVGHIERFNPAIAELKKRIDANELGAIYHIETRRRGPFPKQVLDVGVSLDLAVHDIDLIRYICSDDIKTSHHISAQRIHAKHEDFLRAMFEMESGAMATLSIDWLTPTKIRDVMVSGEKGMFRVDLLTQDLTFIENIEAVTSNWDHISKLRGVNEGRIIKLVIQKSEPLVNELVAFIEAIRSEGDAPVSGKDGCVALLHAQEMAMEKQ